MVKLHVKNGDESQFLYETTTAINNAQLTKELVEIYNGRLKVERLCGEMECLAEHGILLPYNMQGLTEEQIFELKLKDEWAERCVPSGGFEFCKDDVGRRNGQAPNAKMAAVITNCIKEQKARVSKKLVENNVMMTMETIQDCINMLKGAVTIVYPMGLPPYDPIKMEFDNEEDLSGTQASLKVIPTDGGSIWWAGKELQPTKHLHEFVGRNEKTKLVVKLQKRGAGPPGREAPVSEEEKKQMMLHAYRRQEELKKLEEDEENAYLDADWADNKNYQRKFQGLDNISWKPGKMF